MEAMTALPAQFVERMRALLGAEAQALFAAMAEREQRALRVNLLKLSPQRLRQVAPWPLEPVPWCPTGFYLPDAARPGEHPYHAAGLVYLQEPPARAVG